jgi:hypothetical protein
MPVKFKPKHIEKGYIFNSVQENSKRDILTILPLLFTRPENVTRRLGKFTDIFQHLFLT